MRTFLWILFVPVWAYSQPLQFELQPGAFPVSVDGFQTHQPWAGGMDDITPKFSDLEDDSVLDYYCGQINGYISLFQNIGNGTIPNFQYITSYYDSLSNYHGWGHSDIDFADLNGDSLLDAIVGGSYVLFYHNYGTIIQPYYCNPADTIRDINSQIIVGTHVAVQDIDNDGIIDLLAGHYNGYLRYYHNIGTTQNYAFQLISSNWFNTYTSEGYADPCFGDIDGDEDLDLLIGTGEGHVICYRNDGSPTNPQMILVPNYLNINVQKDASPELADIDGDGDLDLFVGRSPADGQNTTQGDVFFYRNDGTPRNPNFTYVTSNYLTWDCGSSATPRMVDIDADGDPDLLSKIGNKLLLYRNQGSCGNPNFVYESSSFGNVIVADLFPWIVDVNGNGKLDLFAGTSAIPGPPGLQLYLNQGTPQVPNWVCYSTDLVPGIFDQGSVILSPWTADIDADGDQDLFVTDAHGYLYFFRNTGTPTAFQFQYETNNWQNLNDGVPGYLFGCYYDMDGDLDLDLFMSSQGTYPPYNPNNKRLRFYRNHGSPQNPALVLENSDVFPDLMIWNAAPYVIDMDGDNDGDLFVGDLWGGIRFFRNITNQAVHPNPKRPAPTERLITISPNPGNSTIAASYVLRAASKVSLQVYDISGRLTGTLFYGFQLPGTYNFTWDASQKSSGVYLLRLDTPQASATEKIVIMK